jgi:phosphoribosylglycinamide formyltransferase-1
VTVHFVDQKMDHGLIIAQEAVAISDTETLAALEARIHKIEHSIYTEAIRKVLAGKIWVQGRRVICR